MQSGVTGGSRVQVIHCALQDVDKWSRIGEKGVESFIFHVSNEPCCFACKNSLVWS
jgi:hypothetical protein